MKIIDNKKDYYDYLVGIYGLDSDTVYDRRGSVSLKSSDWFNGVYPNLGINFNAIKDNLYIDRIKTKKARPIYNDSSLPPAYGDQNNFCLVIGNTVYHIVTDRYLEGNKDNMIIGGYNIIHNSFDRVDDGVFCPVGLIHYQKYLFLDDRNDLHILELTKGPFNKKYITSVILEGTWLSKLFPAEMVWEKIYDYIRSKKEKKIVDNRTDKEKILSAGFDVKTSFRNIKD